MAEIKSCLVPSPYKQDLPTGRATPVFENLLGQTINTPLPSYQSNLTNLDKTQTAVVMIGGLIETSTVWKRYQDKLDASGIPWVTISLPGFDGRLESANNFTAENSVKVVRQKLEELGQARKANCKDEIKTILIGHSLGANVAFEIAGDNISGLKISETHLLNPAVNAHDWQLSALAWYMRKTEIGNGMVCQNLPSVQWALHELSAQQYMNRAHTSDLPSDVYLSTKLPLTAACEAIKLAIKMERGVESRSRETSLQNYFAYEATNDALLKPSGLQKFIQTTNFPRASHFLQTNSEGMVLLDEIINRIKKN